MPDQSYVLERNPNWDPETDDLREAYVDRIEITLGQESESVFQQIIAGTVDMQWGETTVPTQEIPALLASRTTAWSSRARGPINPYLVINTLSPNADGAFANPLVRQALNFAVDRKRSSRSSAARPVRPRLPHPAAGSAGLGGHQPAEHPGDGDPDKARELLTQAGYPDGCRSSCSTPTSRKGRTLAALLEEVLGDSGFDVELVFAAAQRVLRRLPAQPEFTESGGWDIAPVSWYADYLAGRAYMVPMIDGRGYASGRRTTAATTTTRSTRIDAAIAASTPEEAAMLWAEADLLATIDGAWVPIAFTKTPTIHGDRVGGFQFHAVIRNGDFSNVWLEG